MEMDHPITNGFDRVSAYSYLMEWEWPEHIEAVLRRLLYLSLSQATADLDDEQVTESDHLAARLAWLISVCPDSNPAILHALAQQQPAAFVGRIAENPNTLPETLQNLSTHPSEKVRAAVAENPQTPEAVLMELVNDEHVDVRYAMAENPNLPESVLLLLTEDENCYVSARAHRTINRIAPPPTAVLPLRIRETTQTAMRKAAQM
jgi:hypothetical protein